MSESLPTPSHSTGLCCGSRNRACSLHWSTVYIQTANHTMNPISPGAPALHSLQRALPLCTRALPAAPIIGNTRSRAGRDHVSLKQHKRPAALLDGGSGGDGNGARQQHSIQHPLFPDAQQAAAGALPVQTQRGLPLFEPMIGSPPCPACGGTGKTTCGDCRHVPTAASKLHAACLQTQRAGVCVHASKCCPVRHLCRGKGRLNYRGTAMLPQGVWPQW